MTIWQLLVCPYLQKIKFLRLDHIFNTILISSNLSRFCSRTKIVPHQTSSISSGIIFFPLAETSLLVPTGQSNDGCGLLTFLTFCFFFLENRKKKKFRVSMLLSTTKCNPIARPQGKIASGVRKCSVSSGIRVALFSMSCSQTQRNG